MHVRTALALLALSAAVPVAAQVPSGVLSESAISSLAGGFTGPLADGDFFGGAVASLGDLDGDGGEDLAVGACFDDDGGSPSFLFGRGAVWVLFLDPSGTLVGEQKISATQGAFGGTLDLQDSFGASLAAVGDLDGDGVEDVAVGTPGDDDGGADRGALWILFLQADGTVKSEQKISATAGGLAGPLADGDGFGTSVAVLGDLGGDGSLELAVGAPGDDGSGVDRGAVHVLSLATDGTVLGEVRIGDAAGGFPAGLDDGDAFGRSVGGAGDVDGDGTPDLAVGAVGDDSGGGDRGAVWVLFLAADGTVAEDGGAARVAKVAHGVGGFPGLLDNADEFGSSLAGLGDLQGEGGAALAVGTRLDDDGGANRGAVWIVNLDQDGLVTGASKVSQTAGAFGGTLSDYDTFGASVTLRGSPVSGFFELFVGAPLADDGGLGRGAVWGLSLGPSFPSAVVSRNGLGVNLEGFVSLTSPLIGDVWQSTLDLATPGASLGVVLIGLGGPTSGLVLDTPYLSGELLALPKFLSPAPTTLDGNLSIPLPANPTLLGVTFSCQGATASGGLPLELQNAIDITLGTF